jgi:hypothetical protein
MESNGKPYKIHVSETTAELIRAAGKGFVISCYEVHVHCERRGCLESKSIGTISDHLFSFCADIGLFPAMK